MERGPWRHCSQPYDVATLYSKRETTLGPLPELRVWIGVEDAPSHSAPPRPCLAHIHGQSLLQLEVPLERAAAEKNVAIVN